MSDGSDTAKGDTSTESEMNRRNVLKSVAITGGLSTTFITDATGARRTPSFGDGDTTKIPYILRGDEVVEWKEVPASWKSHIDRVLDATEKAQRAFLDLDGLVSIGSTRWSRTFGGKNGLLIKAEVLPEAYSGGLPDSVDGIPVKKEEIQNLPEPVNCSNQSEFDPVPGGVMNEDPNGGLSTTGVAVNDGSTRTVTAAYHAYRADSSTCDDVTGKSADQGCADFGSVLNYDAETDWVTLNPDSNNTVNGYIQEEGGTSLRVDGHYSETGVCDLVSNSTTVRQQGITTGLTKGGMTDCNVNVTNDSDISDACITYEGEGIKTDANVGNGDSGGPIYKRRYSDGEYIADVVGLTSHEWGDSIDYIQCNGCGDGYSTTTSDGSAGTAFYHLNNQYGLDLIIPSYTT